MSSKDKLIKRFFKEPPPKDFKWAELVSLLKSLGFHLVETGGSHNYFICNKNGNKYRINAAKPHPDSGIKIYMMKQIAEKLKDWGMV